MVWKFSVCLTITFPVSIIVGLHFPDLCMLESSRILFSDLIFSVIFPFLVISSSIMALNTIDMLANPKLIFIVQTHMLYISTPTKMFNSHLRLSCPKPYPNIHITTSSLTEKFYFSCCWYRTLGAISDTCLSFPLHIQTISKCWWLFLSDIPHMGTWNLASLNHLWCYHHVPSQHYPGPEI